MLIKNITSITMESNRIMRRVGHVHLKVRNLERAGEFYTKILGLRVAERVGRYLFLTYGIAHHDIALNEVGESAPLPSHDMVGLYHVAIEVESLSDFKDVYKRLVAAGVAVETVDHGISLALYFTDPDDNGIEVYIDRRNDTGRTTWDGRDASLDVNYL